MQPNVVTIYANTQTTNNSDFSQQTIVSMSFAIAVAFIFIIVIVGVKIRIADIRTSFVPWDTICVIY